MKKLLIVCILGCGQSFAATHLACEGTSPNGKPSSMQVTLNEGNSSVVFIEDGRGVSVSRPAQFLQDQVLWKHEVIRGMITMNYQIDRVSGDYVSYVTADKSTKGKCSVAVSIDRKF